MEDIIGHYYFTAKQGSDPKYKFDTYDVKEYLTAGKNEKEAKKKLKKKLKKDNKNRFIYGVVLQKEGYSNEPKKIVAKTQKYKYSKKTNDLKLIEKNGYNIFTRISFSKNYLDKNKGVVFDDLKKVVETAFYLDTVQTFDFTFITEEQEKSDQWMIDNFEEYQYMMKNKLPYDVEKYTKYLGKGINKKYQYYYVNKVKGKKNKKIVKLLGASNSEKEAEKETLDILKANPERYEGKTIYKYLLKPMKQEDIVVSEQKTKVFTIVGGPIQINITKKNFIDGKLETDQYVSAPKIYISPKFWKKNKGMSLTDYKKIALIVYNRKFSDALLAVNIYENGKLGGSSKSKAQRREIKAEKKAKKQKEIDDIIKERDEILSCGPNKLRNPKTGRCVKDDGKIGREIYRDKLRFLENKIATFEKKQQKKQKKKI